MLGFHLSLGKAWLFRDLPVLVDGVASGERLFNFVIAIFVINKYNGKYMNLIGTGMNMDGLFLCCSHAYCNSGFCNLTFFCIFAA